MRQRLLLGALGTLALLAAVMFSSVWAMLAIWDSAYRHWIAGGILSVLLVLGMWCVCTALPQTVGAVTEPTVEPNVFPRSRTMRALSDPRYQWLRVAAIAAATLLVKRHRSPR
jgi:hypothetical protein